MFFNAFTIIFLLKTVDLVFISKKSLIELFVAFKLWEFKLWTKKIFAINNLVFVDSFA